MSREMLYIAEETMSMRVAEEHRRADERRLQRLIRKSERVEKPRPADRLLYRLGHTLMALGHRLEQYGLPPAQRLPEIPSGAGSGR
jgi:hypothetical protein